MKMPKVSVIIPTYNSELYIREAIESALAQTYKDLEIIVIDDASTDKTGQIAKSFGSGLTYIRHSSNRGPSAARNTGIKHINGEYIAFLDSDDVWLPNKIQEQIKLLENNRDTALVYSDGYRVNLLGLEMGLFFNIAKPHRGLVFKELLLDNFIPTSSVIIRKQILNEVGRFNERFLISQDFELYIRIAEYHKIDFVDSALIKYRVHPDSLTIKKKKVLLDEVVSISKFYRDKVSSHDSHLARKLDRAIAKYMFYMAVWSLEHTNRREAVSQYFYCLKTGAFDYKIALGSIFFIMPKFISALLVRNLLKIQSG